jgi:hypothetical protein
MDEQKDLEKLIDKIFDADRLDAPSVNFTESILEKIEAEKKSKVTYTPLLPKWVFVAVGVLVSVFVAYVISITDAIDAPQVNYFESLNFSTTWLSENISQFSFTNSFGYSILAAGLLVCLQAGLLNKVLNKPNSFA